MWVCHMWIEEFIYLSIYLDNMIFFFIITIIILFTWLHTCHNASQGSNCEKWTGRVSNTAGTKGLGVTME